jgi:protein phosphatase
VFRALLVACTVLLTWRTAAAASYELQLEDAPVNLLPLVVIIILTIAVAVLTFLLIRTRRQGAPPPAEAPFETPTQPSLTKASPTSPTLEAPQATAPVETPPESALAEIPPTPEQGAPYVPSAPIPQFLEARTADGKLRRFSLDRPLLTVGRAADNAIVIGDEFPAAASVADHHARVKLRDSSVILEAVSLSEPVFVNGQRTGKNILRNGWRMTLGELDLTFRTAGLGTAPLAEPESAEVTQPTQRAPQLAEESRVALLPDGALLADHYVVLEAHSETPALNSYVVESFQAMLRCAQCGHDTNSLERKTCRNCGAPLVGSMPYYPHYHIKESLDEGTFGAERQLIGLSHPNVLLPRDAFAEIPYGDAIRYYLVGPEAPSQLAANIRVPQEMLEVLEWAQQLAQGMAYMHGNGVALGPIDLWRVALENKQARWVDFAPCEFVEESARPLRFPNEVRALAEVAYYLLTGKRHYDESLEISPPGVGMLFDRLLGGLEAPTAAQFATALQAGLVEVRRPSSADVRVGRLTDVGQIRRLNEDSLLTLEISRVRRSISEPLGLYVVCDGMGGHAAGDVASGLVVQTLAHKALAEVMSDGIAEGTRPNWETWLKSAIQEANQAVFGHRRASGTDMGTTCVAALVHGDTAIIAHAGDSRCYLINEQGIRQLTADHSLVQRLVQLGQLTPEEARVHPQRNVIYKNLGDKPVVEPDVIQQQLAAGDHLLLCSDGLSGMVEDSQLRQIVMTACSPQEACRKLIQAANEAGGDDNISVILLQMDALD